MAMKRLETRQIIRSVLTRHWIDTDRVQVNVSRFCVRLSGELRCLPAGGRRFLDLRTAGQILQELRRIPGIGRIQTPDLLAVGPDGQRCPVSVQ